MASYAPLFPLEKQFQAKSGRNNTGGWLKVYLAATDDLADTYSDYLGTRNPEKIVLDDNGRAIVICDKARAYRLEVYDISGALLWTEEPLYCSGTGGGGVSVTRVVSTDGSINVESATQGSTVVYDIGMAPPDSDEFLEWIKCSEEDCGATWKPVWQAGTMETEAGQGIKVHAGRLYHFTCSFTVDPDGTGVNYDTFHVNMYCGSTIVESRSFDIDSSLTDEVLCEFSHDLIPEADGCVYFTLTIPSTCEVTGEVQVHRVYSGINAVPDTCATKQWVQETFDYNMSGRIPYSALGYNASSQITGINGSSIAGGIDSTAVSSIAQTYAQSAASGKQDASAMTAYALSANVSGVIDTVSSNSAMWGSATGDYVEKSAMEVAIGSGNSVVESAFAQGYLNSASSFSLSQGLQNNTVNVSLAQGRGNNAQHMSLSQGSYNGSNLRSLAQGESNLGGDNSLAQGQSNSASAGGLAQGLSNTAYNRSLGQGTRNSASLNALAQGDRNSADYDALAQGDGNTANNDAFAQGRYNIAYNDSFAQGDYNSASHKSFAQGSNLSARYTAAVFGTYNLRGDGSNTGNSAAFAIGDGTADSARHDLMLVTKNGEITMYSSTADTAGTGIMSSLRAISAAASGSVDSATVSAIASAYSESAASSKLDSSASSSFYTVDNPSGFITGVDLTPYQLTADMSAYQPSGDYAYNSAVSSKLDSSAFTAYTATALTGIQQDTADISAHVSGLTGQYVEKSAISAESAQWNNVSAKLDASASSNYYTTANESGYVDSAYVESQVSGKQDASAMTAYQPSGDYAYNSAVSSKLDNSASSNFYPASNPSGFIPGVTTDSSMTGDGSVASPLGVERVDLVFDSSMKTSVSGDSAVIGVNESALDLSSYQRVSAMTAYQPVSGMTAYQPSGDYYSATNPSGFITGVDLSPYAYQSSLSSKLDASASSSFLPASSSADLFTGVHTDSSMTGNGLSSSPLGVERVDLVFTSGITTSISGDSALVYLDSGYMSSYAKDSALSSKLDASASSSFYTVDNPSGFITGVDLSPYATTAYVDSSVSSKLDATASASFQPSGNYQPSGDYAYNSSLQDYQPVSGMTAYAPSGDYADSSALDLKLDASASSSYYTTANESGFVDSAYVDSQVSGKLDTTAFSDVSGTFLTSVDLTPYQLTADMSGYIPTGESANYQQASAMTAYQLSGDYAYNSALSAYQPSGDYIYASALGTGEI